jgi:diketogulonate reductase-like aldo/keto reductase
MGFAVIPGSRNVDHIRDNMNILDFTLTEDEMAEIAKLNRGVRYYTRTEEALAGFAAWQPTYEKA